MNFNVKSVGKLARTPATDRPANQGRQAGPARGLRGPRGFRHQVRRRRACHAHDLCERCRGADYGHRTRGGRQGRCRGIAGRVGAIAVKQAEALGAAKMTLRVDDLRRGRDR